MRPSLLAATLAATLPATAVLSDISDFEPQLRELVAGELSVLATAPEVIEALRYQNAAHAGITQSRIATLDAAWRAEVSTDTRPMVMGVLTRDGSGWLRRFKDGMGGLVTEVFIMDAYGLNTLQADATSDYWQGDEDKWTMVYGMPAGTIHLGEIELDESSQTYQSQVSFPINDPETGAPLGAATVGINIELLTP